MRLLSSEYEHNKIRVSISLSQGNNLIIIDNRPATQNLSKEESEPQKGGIWGKKDGYIN